ncbi:UDP-N-acetylmuramoyl-tripeptide--D-alanyl-D-alanine ligase [Dethiosulfovibrio sp. F2B]|uniref:UDP-N-acetylmuramoyl-tripeptide--D-alanyl-D- alanine ligase n=1 Tax=Dethiosulfovibrio faecalis TaxID=2720018 RepID=UPI001F3BF5B6|nr:UDP-N-acetylmuramoyl-tripeptide--D-alanyl-D-alanine ligase [Dethiosulfovibrio faecalis]MCF4150532.1 UDP-N-acetylmuramoyl-tripeptide--D-alanyl-D-alanine ligase [Dethiosulfovibrio faecalis]
MSTKIRSWSKYASLAEGTLKGDDGEFSGLIRVDSRKIEEGDLFVALPGNNVDGHDFILNAVSRGAHCALVSPSWREKIKTLPVGFRVIEVDDPEQGLIRIARHRLKGLKKAIAVTGSVGKTSTREMIFLALGGTSSGVYRARSSHNTRIGCALTAAEMPEDTSVLILEMGTSHPGEISEMIDLYPVDTAVITEIAPAHLEGLGSLEGVLEAKLEILGSSNLRKVIFNGDNFILSSALKNRSLGTNWRAISVGISGDYVLENICLDWQERPVLSMTIGRELDRSSYGISAEIAGIHNASLLGMAWATAVESGVSPEEASIRLSSIKPYRGRGVLKDRDGILVLDESYNANPKSMGAMLDLVAQSPFPREKRILVLGEMGELGEGSLSLHEEILKKALPLGKVFLFGVMWGHLKPPVKVYEDIESLSSDLKSLLSEGDFIAIKGSRSNELERLMEIFP